MSRWERWTTKPKQGMSLSGFIAEQQSPAEMAKSMGLQSDGSGGYIDPETGQIAARTVNNELVFYDPMGGAISAQSDGAALTQAQPSWRDPVTGEITVPPGQAESPEEIAAIPDVVPALAPASYNAFMTKKKKDMYAQQGTPEQEEIDDVQQEVDPQLGMEGEVQTENKTFIDMIEDLEGMKKLQSAQSKAKKQAPRIAKSTKPTVPTDVQTDIDKGLRMTPPRIKERERQKQNDSYFQQARDERDELESTPRPTPPRVRSTRETIRNSFKPEDGVSENNVNALSQEDLEMERDNLHEISTSWRERHKDAWDTESKFNNNVKKRLEPLLELLRKVPESQRNHLSEMIIKNMSNSGYNNNQANTLSHDEIMSLAEQADDLRDIDGKVSGRPDPTKALDFVKSKSPYYGQINDELLESMIQILPPGHKFRARDKRERYRRILEQGGLDAYTGLPLDLDASNWEHIISSNTRHHLNDPEFDWATEDQKQALMNHVDSLDNMVEINRGPNQKKSGNPMGSLIAIALNEKNFDPEYLKWRIDSFESKKGELRNSAAGHLGQGIMNNPGGKDAVFHEEVTEEKLRNGTFNAIGMQESKERDLLMSGLSSLDPDGLLDINGRSREYQNLTDEQKSYRSELKSMQKDINSLQSKTWSTVLDNIGITKTIRDAKDERGSKPVHDHLTQMVSFAMMGKSPEEQLQIKNKWNELVKETSRITRTDKDKSQENMKRITYKMYNKIANEFPDIVGDIFDRESDDFGTDYSGVRKELGLFRDINNIEKYVKDGKSGLTGLEEDYDPEEEMEEEIDVYELADRIKSFLSRLDKKSKSDRLNFESFRAKIEE